MIFPARPNHPHPTIRRCRSLFYTQTEALRTLKHTGTEPDVPLLIEITDRIYNRLDYGTKYCKDSVTVDEESLHAAIMEAIHAARGRRGEMLPVLSAHVERTLREKSGGTINMEQIEQRIAELRASTMELVAQSIGDNTVTQNEARLKAMSDEIKSLHDILVQYREQHGTENTLRHRVNEMTEIITGESKMSEYNDSLVRQLIQTIEIMGEDRLMITFQYGIQYEQPISLKVRKLNKAS